MAKLFRAVLALGAGRCVPSSSGTSGTSVRPLSVDARRSAAAAGDQDDPSHTLPRGSYGELSHPLGYAAVFLFGFLEACCVPIPSAITFAFAGVLAGEGYLSIFGVIVVGTVAELIGSLVSYALGRAGGRALIDRFGRYLLITRANLGRAERFLVGRGVWAIPLGRALPVLRSFVSIAAGLIEVPPLLFGVLSLLGTVVWVTTMSLIGYGVGTAWHSIAHGIAIAGYVIALVVVAAVAAFIVSRLRVADSLVSPRAVPPIWTAADFPAITSQGAYQIPLRADVARICMSTRFATAGRRGARACAAPCSRRPYGAGGRWGADGRARPARWLRLGAWPRRGPRRPR